MKVTIALFSLLTLAFASPIAESAVDNTHGKRVLGNIRVSAENNVCCDAYGKVTWCLADEEPNCQAN